MTQKQLHLSRVIFVFVAFTAYFYLLLFTLLPFLKANFFLNPALYWFITGFFLFIPIFLFSIFMVWVEGNKKTKHILNALYLKPFSKIEWQYSIIGLLLVFVFTGLIFGVSYLLNTLFGIRELSTTPWFMEIHPFQGYEKFLLLVWLPMFFFNIVGEELLWRGYLQARLKGKYSWLFCSILWLVFHLPFGIDLLIMLTPISLIIPYAFHKTKNTLVGVFIHGIYNGPIFVAVALGLLK